MARCEAVAFLSPTIGAFQYLGAMQMMVALRCYAALVAKVRDVKQTLEAMIYLNLSMLTVAGVRAYMGSAPSKKNVVIFALLSALSYFGWTKA